MKYLFSYLCLYAFCLSPLYGQLPPRDPSRSPSVEEYRSLYVVEQRHLETDFGDSYVYNYYAGGDMLYGTGSTETLNFSKLRIPKAELGQENAITRFFGRPVGQGVSPWADWASYMYNYYEGGDMSFGTGRGLFLLDQTRSGWYRVSSLVFKRPGLIFGRGDMTVHIGGSAKKLIKKFPKALRDNSKTGGGEYIHLSCDLCDVWVDVYFDKKRVITLVIFDEDNT